MKILILGCGWVGEEFALHMLEDHGAAVWASVTSIEKAARLCGIGINAFVYDFDVDNNIPSDFPLSFDYVLTSVPAASKCTVDEVKNRFFNVLSFLQSVRFIRHIYLSSIGVYPDIDGDFIEEYDGELNERLSATEQKMLAIFNTTVYRLGGLFGKQRVFAKYFVGRVCTTGTQLANFVHLDDVVSLMYLGFVKGTSENVYNVICPEHPMKKEVIQASAAKYGFPLPSTFADGDTFQKRVLSNKIVKELGYAFKYRSPLDF